MRAQDVLSIGDLANRTGSKFQAMAPKEFQKALGHKVQFTIPDDPKTFNLAANNGKSVAQIQARGQVSKAIRKILEEVAETPEDSEGGKPKLNWRRLFKRK